MVKKSYSGFTLVELMIVLVIIGILAALIVMYIVNQINKANDAKRLADINRIQEAVEEFEKDHNCYPPADKMLTCGTDPSIAIYPYLNNVPCDPVTHKAYVYEVPSGNVCPDWYRFQTEINNSPYYISSPNAPTTTPAPTSTPGGGSGGVWGCKNGTCEPVAPGSCSTTYNSNDCYGQCGSPGHGTNNCNPIIK
jgi:general secretion pathway protein G